MTGEGLLNAERVEPILTPKRRPGLFSQADPVVVFLTQHDPVPWTTRGPRLLLSFTIFCLMLNSPHLTWQEPKSDGPT